MAASDCVDLLIVGGGINGAGIARDAAGRGSESRAGRAGGSRRRHLFGEHQADPRRAALSRVLRVPPGARIADRARAPAAHRPAPRAADAVHPAARAGTAAALADPLRAVLLRLLQRPAHAAALAQRARRRRRLRRAASRHRSRVRVFRLLGRRQPPGRAQCAGRRAARRGDPHADALRLRDGRERRVARAMRATGKRRIARDPRARDRQRGRSLGRAGSEIVSRRGGRRQRAPRERQPHRRAAAVRGQARVHAAEPRRPDRVRDSLRAEVDAGRHDRRAVLRRPRAGANRGRRDPLPVRHDQQLLPASDRAERRALDAMPACGRSSTTHRRALRA